MIDGYLYELNPGNSCILFEEEKSYLFLANNPLPEGFEQNLLGKYQISERHIEELKSEVCGSDGVDSSILMSRIEQIIL